MATGLLKQPQWGSGARAHKQIQRCSACLCCALVSCAGYGLQEGMSQYYYSDASANSGEKKTSGGGLHEMGKGSVRAAIASEQVSVGRGSQIAQYAHA